jgi:hypothetical protein
MIFTRRLLLQIQIQIYSRSRGLGAMSEFTRLTLFNMTE